MKSKLSLLLGTAILASSVWASVAAAEVKPESASIQQVASAFPLVPLRQVFEDVGAVVEWDEETRSAIIDWEAQDISIIIDMTEKSALYGGKQFFFESADFDIVKGSIQLSVEFIEEVTMGKLVDSNGVYSISKEVPAV